MLTIGKILKKARIYKNISIDDLSNETKINKNYIQDIENDYFVNFQSNTQLYGFVCNMCDFIGVDKTKLTAIFKRQIQNDQKNLNIKDKVWQISSIVINYKTIFFISISVFFAFIVFFLIFQWNNLQKSPNLSIEQPSNQSINVDNANYTIKGIIELDVYLTINNEQIQYDKKTGAFSYNILLQSGENKIKITAISQAFKNKKTIKEFIINYKKQEIIDKLDQNLNQKITMKIVVKTVLNESWLQIVTDNIQQYVGVLKANTIKKYDVKNSFFVDTGRPKNTEVYVNDKKIDWKINTNGSGKISCKYENQEVSCNK